MSSTNYRKAILDAFKKINVSIDISPEELVNMIDASRKLVITFTDEDLHPEWPSQNRALYAIMLNLWNRVLVYLVDNG